LLTTDESRRTFEAALERVRSTDKLRVYAYVIMPEHVHLLLSEPERRILSEALKSLKQGYPAASLAGPSISGKNATTISISGTIRSLSRK